MRAPARFSRFNEAAANSLRIPGREWCARADHRSFNEAAANSLRIQIAAADRGNGPIASMRPQRIRCGYEVAPGAWSEWKESFNEAAANSLRILESLASGTAAVLNASMRPQRIRCGYQGIVKHEDLLDAELQ